MSQTEYKLNQPIGVVGSFSDNGPRDVVTFIANEKTPFGQLTSRLGGSDKLSKLPNTATDITNAKNLAGIAALDQARESKEDGLPAGYEAKDAVSTLKEGRIYVRVEDAVTPASDVFVRFQGRPQIQTQVWSGAFAAGETINGEVNGVAIAEVAWDTDQATTLGNLAAEIQLNPDVATAVSDGTDTITVTAVTDKEVSLTNFVAVGGNAPTVIHTETQSLVSTYARGSFRSDNAGGLAAQLLEAKFRSSAAAGEIAELEIDV